MYCKRALQQPAIIRLLSNSKSNCLHSFSTNCDGLSFAKTATTSPAILLPVRRPPRKFVNVSRSFNTAAEIKTGITDIQRNLMWKKTIENGHMEWPADLKRAFKGIRSSIAVISLPSGKIQATGTIISPDGYIVTTANVFKSLKAYKTAEAKVKVVIHEKEYNAAQVVLIDYPRNIAFVKVNPKDGFLEVPKFSEWWKSCLFPHFYVGTCNPIDNAPNQFMGKRYTHNNYNEINEGNKQHELLKLSPEEGQCYFSYHDDKASYDDFRSNLGGPIVNKNGQVVGIVTTTSCCNDFALPSRLLFKIFRHFLENGKNAELIEDLTLPEYIYSHEAKSSDDDCDYDDDDDDDNHLFAKKGEKNDNIAQVHADNEPSSPDITPHTNNNADDNTSSGSSDDDDNDTSSSSDSDDGSEIEDNNKVDDEDTIITDAKTGTSEGALPVDEIWKSIPDYAKTTDEVVLLPDTEMKPPTSITSNNNVDHHEDDGLPDSEIRPMLSIAKEILRLQRTLLSDPYFVDFRYYADAMKDNAQYLLHCVRQHEKREKADLESFIKFLDQTYDDVIELEDHFNATISKVEDAFAKAKRTIEDMRARALEEQKRCHHSSDSDY